MFKHAMLKRWYETFWAFDIHGTILVPTFKKNSKDSKFYPWAKETLQYMDKYRPDIVKILLTSSYPEEIEYYDKVFKQNDINFTFINENPKVKSHLGNFGYYEKKFYFNVSIEDKAGFVPEIEWFQIYSLLKKYEGTDEIPDPKWPAKY